MNRVTSALGMVAVAEGIETVEQLRWVRDLGLFAREGFLFGVAVPAGEFAEGVGRALDPTIEGTDAATIADGRPRRWSGQATGGVNRDQRPRGRSR